MLIAVDYPWLSVSGFGAHIKSTQKHLIIQKKTGTDHYPLEKIKNLLVVGGHTISSATISHLVKNGACITFFEPDGTPVGSIKPYNNGNEEEIRRYQETIPRQRYAIALAQASVKSRLFAIERLQESQNVHLFYEGELDFLKKSEEELEYLIKLDEIRRLHKLTSDMYYEIMSRNIPPDLGFRRRTMRPQTDPVNAMLSFGYAMLFGNCFVAVVGARLDPDMGLMYEGKGSLVHDLIEPLKADMVDPIVFPLAKKSLVPADFEITQDRCMLSDDVINTMMKAFYTSSLTDKVNEQVYNFYNAIRDNQEFKILY
ncbi:MAG: CRISPR-associated endonuclease Cas1 [Methanoregula sp.]|nr:CRISPR-associated endonuclease Cas1 [Methanoregula sp.]